MSRIEYTFWKKNATKIGIIAVVLLVLVLTPLGIEANGAKRWLGVGGATIQPAEIAKFACILITAKLIEKRYDNIKSLTKGVLPLLIVPGTFFILIMGQPNMSTAGTIILVTFVGGLFGLGLGKSKQKYFYIPEPQNDFIFAIIGEELGLIGCIVVMMLFLILVYRCIRIALKCSDIFSCMVVIGIGAQIGIQAALNIAVATSSMPATGVALPFISMGGTSLTILMGAVGIVLNISKHVKIN